MSSYESKTHPDNALSRLAEIRGHVSGHHGPSVMEDTTLESSSFRQRCQEQAIRRRWRSPMAATKKHERSPHGSRSDKGRKPKLLRLRLTGWVFIAGAALTAALITGDEKLWPAGVFLSSGMLMIALGILSRTGWR